MAEILVYPYLNPRIIEVLSPTVTVSIQELVDLIRAWEDSTVGMGYPFLLAASGKEDLGGGVLVGITAQLQNAKIAFQQRSVSDSNGGATTADPDGTKLIDSSGTFISDGIQAGDSIFNQTDLSMTTVLSVDSEIQLQHFPLEGGSLNTWSISDSYRVWNKIQCEVNGGNLVAVDEFGATQSSFLPTAETHVVRTSASSATLTESDDIEYASFQNGVWIDTSSGNTGTTFPTGTPRQAVNNIADATIIATARGFTRFYIIGDITFGATDNIDGFEIIGQGTNRSDIIITPGCSTILSEFQDCELSGTTTGAVSVKDCHIETLSEIGDSDETTFFRCFLEVGTIKVNAAATETVSFVDCVSGVPGAATPIFDLNGSSIAFLFRNYYGSIEIINYSGSAEHSFDLSSGNVILDSTSVVSGTFIVRGVGKLIDENGVAILTGTWNGGVTIINELISPTDIKIIKDQSTLGATRSIT